jgi:CheY-like chemotaxis protein
MRQQMLGRVIACLRRQDAAEIARQRDLLASMETTRMALTVIAYGLAMTADATAAHRVQYIAEGLDGYVSKPLTLETLRTALSDHLPQRA